MEAPLVPISHRLLGEGETSPTHNRRAVDRRTPLGFFPPNATTRLPSPVGVGSSSSFSSSVSVGGFPAGVPSSVNRQPRQRGPQGHGHRPAGHPLRPLALHPHQRGAGRRSQSWPGRHGRHRCASADGARSGASISCRSPCRRPEGAAAKTAGTICPNPGGEGWDACAAP